MNHSWLTTIKHALNRLLISCLVYLFLLHAFVNAYADETKRLKQYRAHFDQATWRTMQSPKEKTQSLSCVLEQRVADYGQIRFVSDAGQDIKLHIESQREPIYATTITIDAMPPAWLANSSPVNVAVTQYAASGKGPVIEGDLAWKILSFLEDGQEIRFAYVNYAHDNQVETYLSPTHFRVAFAEFMNCHSSLLPFGFDDIKITLVNFDFGAFTLNDSAKSALWRIKHYFEIDPAIRLVTIEGHADNVGSPKYNQFLSEKRALMVRKFFLDELQLPKDKVLFKGVGGSEPVASNQSDRGRAMNRRVVVKLYMDDQAVFGKTLQ